EPTESLWISQDVDLDDLVAHDGEAEHGKPATIGEAAHEAYVAIHEDNLIRQSKLRERRGLCHDRLSPTHDARHALHRSAIGPQYNLRIEHGDQRFEVTIVDGREKRVDDATLLLQIRI